MIILTIPSFAFPPAASPSAGHIFPDMPGKPHGTMLKGSRLQVLTMWHEPFTPSLAWIMPHSNFIVLTYWCSTPNSGNRMYCPHQTRGFFYNCITPSFKNVPPRTSMRYLSAESVVAGLEKLKAIITIREIACTHSISIRHDRLLEQYLQQAVMETPIILPINIGSYCALPHPQEPDGSSSCSAAFHR